jgi:molybdopterin converting factor small subunit
MEEGATVRKLFEKCQIPFDVPKIIFLNGVHAWGDEGLKDGDRVGAFPPVAGG